MASSINASTSGAGGLISTADNTGILQLQSASTTVATINGFGIGLGTGVPSSGIGITFPSTQSASSDANTLDDYEEGSFTPSWGGETSAPTVTYAVQLGYYTKIGNIVNVIIGLVNSAKSGGSGNLTITGLPFVPGGGGSLNALGGSIIAFTTGWAGTASLSAFIQSGNSNMLLYVANNSSTRNTTADLGAGTYMYIHAIYRTA